MRVVLRRLPAPLPIAALFALTAVVSAGAAEAARPNVVWFVVDDMSPDLPAYRDVPIATPHLDRLAREGTLFTHAYTTAPVCSPSRSAMITGMHQTAIGGHHHRSGRGARKIHLPEGVRPVPRLFQEAGYYTCIGSGLAAGDRTDRRRPGLGKTDYNFEWDPEMYDGEDWSGRTDGQPFFMQVTLPGGKIRGERPESFAAAAAQAARTFGQPTRPEDVSLPPYLPRDPVLLADRAAYLDSVRLTDHHVGQVLARLEAEGVLDDTLVIFMTDHGISHARAKQFLYDEGTHIPFIVRGPGVPRGGVRADFVQQIDMAPTSLAAAGIPIPRTMQGRDLFAAGAQPRDAVFAARDRCDETVDKIRSVRTDRFLYIRNFYPGRPHLQPNAYKDGKASTETLRRLHAAGELPPLTEKLLFSPTRPPEELYLWRDDPWQLENLAADPARRGDLEACRELLDRWMREMPEPPAETEAEYDADMAVSIGKGNPIVERNIATMKRQAAEEGKADERPPAPAAGTAPAASLAPQSPLPVTILVPTMRLKPAPVTVTGMSAHHTTGSGKTDFQARVGENDALVPLTLLDHLDVTTHRYDPNRRTIEVHHSGTTFVFTLDSLDATRNGIPVRLEIPPAIIGDAVMLPIAALAREFRADLDLTEGVGIFMPTIVPHPTLTWKAQLYHRHLPLDYTVQIAEDDAFAAIVVSDTVALTGQYVPRKPLTPGDYWWRVKPMTGSAPTDGWQAPQRLRVVRPAKEVLVKAGSSPAEIHARLQEAARHSPAVVTFEKSEYTGAASFDYLTVKKNPGQWGGGINSAPLLELVGAKNLIIDGQGSRFVLEDDTSICKFIACRNIVLRNASFTTPVPLKPAGRVLSVDPDRREFTLRIIDGFPTPDDKPHYYRAYHEGFGIFDDTGAVLRNMPTRMGFQGTPRTGGDRTYTFSFADTEKNIADLPVGAITAFVPKQGGAYGALCLMTDYCEDVTFQNIRKYENGGYNFMCHYTDRLKFLDVVEKPATDFGRNEGGLILSGRAGAWLDGYETYNSMDDGLQYSANVSTIVSKPASNQLILRQFQEIHGSHDLPPVNFEIGKHWRFNDFRVGDELFIYTSQKQPSGRFKVTHLRANDNRTFVVTLDRDIPEDMPFVIEKASFPNGLTVVVNLTAVQTGAAYRNCRFVNIGRNSIYGAASNFLIEHCVFRDIGEDALRVADFALADYQNILIRRNVIQNGDLNRYSNTAVSVGTLMYDRAHTYYGSVSRVFILDNEILDANNNIFGFWAVDKVLVQKNVIRNARHTDFGRSDWNPYTNKLLIARDSGAIAFEGNTVADERALPNPPFALTNVEKFIARGNTSAGGDLEP